MTQNEIEHMWKVASNNPNHDTNWHDPVVEAFAKLVAAKEREWVVQECIGVIEDSEGYSQYFPHVTENIEKHFGVEQ